MLILCQSFEIYKFEKKNKKKNWKRDASKYCFLLQLEIKHGKIA